MYHVKVTSELVPVAGLDEETYVASTLKASSS
jgi:hypothetical protein